MMLSTNTIDRAQTRTFALTHDLLVLWRHPETRRIASVGRFTRDGDQYSFTYTQAASLIEDFRPLPGFPDLTAAYSMREFPVVFRQRIMAPGRPDYARYLNVFGLDPQHATPWEQLVATGGTREGDTLQFMQTPTVVNGRARARFLTNGIRHVPDNPIQLSGRVAKAAPVDVEAALGKLIPGSTVLIEHEYGNPEDEDAAVVTTGGTPIGWVPHVLAASINQLTAGGQLAAVVHRISPPDTPPRLRLVLDLDVPAPRDFRWDPDGMWAPVNSL